MKNLTVKKVIKIDVHFSAEQWQLYVDADPVGARVTALHLNQTLEEYVNRGESRDFTTRIMLSAMRHNESVGANDTEPRAFLNSVLDTIYGQ